MAWLSLVFVMAEGVEESFTGKIKKKFFLEGLCIIIDFMKFFIFKKEINDSDSTFFENLSLTNKTTTKN